MPARTLPFLDADEFFALTEALDQYVANTEDIEDELREAAAAGDARAQEALRRLDAARVLRDRMTAVLGALAEAA